MREFAHGAALARTADCAPRSPLPPSGRMPPAALVANGVGRHPEEIETAVYFCCLEALQNVRKHAGGEHPRGDPDVGAGG